MILLFQILNKPIWSIVSGPDLEALFDCVKPGMLYDGSSASAEWIIELSLYAADGYVRPGTALLGNIELVPPQSAEPASALL